MKYTKLFPDEIEDIQYTDEEVQNSEELKLLAVEQNCDIIYYIKNPSEEIKIAAVKQNGCSIYHINNPSEELQMLAVKEDVCAIRYIKKPTKKVLDYVYESEKKVLEYYYKIEAEVSENDKENVIDIIDTTTSKGVVEFFETYWDRIIEYYGQGAKYFIGCPSFVNPGGVYLSKNENKYNGEIYMTFEKEYSLEETVFSKCDNDALVVKIMKQVDWYGVFNIKE